MTPLLVSKIVFALGIAMLGVIVWRKRNEMRALTQGVSEESFAEFIAEHSHVLRRHFLDAYHVVSRAILRVIFASLHSMKLLSLKLESRTTHWLSHVQKASEKAKAQKEKKLVLELEEMVESHTPEYQAVSAVAKKLNSEEFFSLLKDSPNHDKLKNKLSLIKEETKETEHKVV